ncbi:MAG: hypothetical protein IPL78_31005 [Chloroflexi bacterium]|nr:hypothetical protein [Chloroflexota bacterium]
MYTRFPKPAIFQEDRQFFADIGAEAPTQRPTMQIHLIATGEEPKLHPLTTTMPSPMLPVANRPVLALAVEMLARQGFKEMNVSLAEQGEQIEGYFVNGARWGVKLRYHLQQQGWGDAGAFRWANMAPDETTLVLPGDVIADVDAAAFAQFHKVRGSLLTVVLALPQTGPPTPSGCKPMVHLAPSRWRVSHWLTPAFIW